MSPEGKMSTRVSFLTGGAVGCMAALVNLSMGVSWWAVMLPVFCGLVVGPGIWVGLYYWVLKPMEDEAR